MSRRGFESSDEDMRFLDLQTDARASKIATSAADDDLEPDWMTATHSAASEHGTIPAASRTVRYSPA